MKDNDILNASNIELIAIGFNVIEQTLKLQQKQIDSLKDELKRVEVLAKSHAQTRFDIVKGDK
jgi:hypothetical protein